MTTFVISEAEYQRRTAGLTRDEITEARDAEGRERFLKALRRSKGKIGRALKAIARGQPWLDVQLCSYGDFRKEVLRLVPSQRMEPSPTEFGKWCLQCPKTRERVAFAGDIAVADIQAIALVAAEKHHFPFAVPDVDCIIAGAGADPKTLLGYLAKDGLILGMGIGPQGAEIVSTPTGRYFRMRL